MTKKIDDNEILTDKQIEKLVNDPHFVKEMESESDIEPWNPDNPLDLDIDNENERADWYSPYDRYPALRGIEVSHDINKGAFPGDTWEIGTDELVDFNDILDGLD